MNIITLLFLAAASQAADPSNAERLPMRVQRPVFIFTESMPSRELIGLKGIKGLTLRLMMKGNMLTDKWVNILNEIGAGKVEIVLDRNIKDVHIKQIIRVKKMEVLLDIPDGMVPPETSGKLGRQGPVPVKLIVGPAFNSDSLAQTAAYFSKPSVILNAMGGDFSDAELDVVDRIALKWQMIAGAGNVEKLAVRLKKFKRASLVVEIGDGGLDYDAAYELEQSRIPVTFRVKDSISRENFRSLFGVSEFALEIIPVSEKSINKKFLIMIRESSF